MAGDRRSAILIAGTSSGSGKTTITLGLLAALRNIGLAVQPFKCGPDFIDPGLHQLACGRVSRNLDLWMMGEARVRETFASARQSSGADISVIEGVMGMFDGQKSSSAALAKALGVPVILILDVRSAAESVAAVLKGFEMLDPEVAPVAVILNRVASPRHLELVSAAIRRHCRAEILGHLPQSLDFIMPARHLGLFTGEEQPISPGTLERLAATIQAQINLPRLLELASGATEPEAELAPGRQEYVPVQARIGVARDKAFCFYYEDNLDLLRAAGAELVFFSPLEDRCLPERLDGLYLGGGYPELYARELSGNLEMRQAVYEWAESGRPLSECGGFMYLSEQLVDLEGEVHAMTGVFPVQAVMRSRRQRLGYRQALCRADNLLGPAGEMLRGHEFHYSETSPMPPEVERVAADDEQQAEIYRLRESVAGYLHLHFGSRPQSAAWLVDYCRNKGRTK